MSLNYARVESGIWTGETGRAIRAAGRDAQVVAFYLLTGPTHRSVGLYYLPLPTLCHEIGIKPEGALKALQRLSEGAFSYWDEPSETVYVPEMARFQIGATLHPSDKRHKWLLKEMLTLRKLIYFPHWYSRYKVPYNLPELEGLASPSEAPPKPITLTLAIASRESGSKTAAPRHRVPADWNPNSEETRRIAAERQLTDADVRFELEKFRDHEFPKGHKEWDATWRNWLRRVSDFKRGGSGGRPRMQHKDADGFVC